MRLAHMCVMQRLFGYTEDEHEDILRKCWVEAGKNQRMALVWVKFGLDHALAHHCYLRGASRRQLELALMGHHYLATEGTCGCILTC